MGMGMISVMVVYSFPFLALGFPCSELSGRISFEKNDMFNGVVELTDTYGACSVESNSGNPGAGLKCLAMQGLTLATPWAALAGLPPSPLHGFNITMDLMVKTVSLRGKPVNASLILEFVDQDDTSVDQGYTSVYHDLGEIASGMHWRSVTAGVADINSTTMPNGWQGSGVFHPTLHTPLLPKNRTFASVLANADVLRITTFVPGMYYSTDLLFDVSFDNFVWNLGLACTEAASTTSTTIHV